MKKVRFVLVIVSLITVSSIYGQIRIGAKGSVSVVDAKFSNDVFKADNVTGFYIGPVMELMFGEHGLGFDAAVLYTQKGFKSENQTLKNGYLQVPVNLKYKFGMTGVKPYLAAGPYIDLKISGDDVWKGVKEQIKSESFGAGLNFGAGIELIRMIQLGVNVDWALTDNFSSFETNNKEDYKGKLVTWSGCLVVLF